MLTPILRRAVLALAVALAACSSKPASESGAIAPGDYRLVLSLPSGELPVGLQIGREGDAVTATLVNGENHIRAEQASVAGSTLTFAFPSYDSSLIATAGADGTLRGTATLRRRDGPVTVPLVATPATNWRFYEAPAAPPQPLAGTWVVTPEDPEDEKGLLILRDAGGGKLAGTVQYPTGDVRWLAGETKGAAFALSTFDGNQGSVWRGTIENGVIRGENFGATSKSPAKWTARPQTAAATDQVAAIGEEKPPVDRIAFTFPDARGTPVSLSDPTYRGKVVVVAIGGTWCPNCHDEAAFLVPYSQARKAAGLEVIGLQFEYTDDKERSAAQSRRFAQRFGVTYPLLVAGKATPEDTKRALPAIGGVKVYPTTLFIDRKGKLRAIHTGYAGPATGELNKKTTAAFDALVSKLLAETA